MQKDAVEQAINYAGLLKIVACIIHKSLEIWGPMRAQAAEFAG
jgi:hypothetical protein